GAYQNSTWVVAVAKGGVEDGFHLIAGSIIVNPDGEIVAEAKTEDDESVVADCDLDDTIFGKETIYDFKGHRRVEHYGRITSQTGIVLPPQSCHGLSGWINFCAPVAGEWCGRLSGPPRAASRAAEL